MVKKFISVLVCVVLMCVIFVQMVSAEDIFPSEETNVIIESDSDIGTNFYNDSDIVSSEINNGIMRTVYNLNWTVEAGTVSTGSIRVTLSPGDYYYFNLSFSPVPSGTIDIGGYNRTNSTFYYVSTSESSFERLISTKVAGEYSIRITNNTSSDITVTGTYEAVKFVGSTSLDIPLYQQEKSNWCWAACIEMCAEYMGYETTQSGIVTAAKGSTIDEGGSASDYTTGMKYATNDDYNATRTQNILSAVNIKTILASDTPLIIGFGFYSNGSRIGGHANVVIAVDQDSMFIQTNDPSYSGCSVKTFKYSSITDPSAYKQYDATIQIAENI